MSALSETRRAFSAGSKLFLFGVALAACLCASCNVPLGDALRPYKHVSAEPGRAEIVGTWTPDRATVDDMLKRGGYDLPSHTELILRDDGTYMMLNMPDWLNDGFGESHRGSFSESGRWKLEGAGGHWTIDLISSGAHRAVNLLEHRLRNTPRYYVEFILGDPDSGEQMMFVRKE